jgi:deoxyribonuclease II
MNHVWRIAMVAVLPWQVSSLLSCLDEDGNAVDQWVALSTNENYQYYWHDGSNGFVKSPYDTNQTTNGNIMMTVNQLYNPDLNMNNVAYALYNDDPPPPDTTASSTYAHAKGVMLTDATQGFWLVHSKPNW